MSTKGKSAIISFIWQGLHLLSWVHFKFPTLTDFCLFTIKKKKNKVSLDHPKSSTLQFNFFFFTITCGMEHHDLYKKIFFSIQYVCKVEWLCHNVECLPIAFSKSNVLCDLQGCWRDIYGIRVSISIFQANMFHSILTLPLFLYLMPSAIVNIYFNIQYCFLSFLLKMDSGLVQQHGKHMKIHVLFVIYTQITWISLYGIAF